MSLFGPADDTDLRRWQREKLIALTELVNLGQEKRLPPLAWKLPDGAGDLIGTVAVYGRDQHPRTVFDAWCTALAGHRRIEPLGLGLNRDQPSRSERTFNDGQTRLLAGFLFHLTDRPHPTANVVLIAEWWDDEAGSDTETG
jgi:hypothetical protein